MNEWMNQCVRGTDSLYPGENWAFTVKKIILCLLSEKRWSLISIPSRNFSRLSEHEGENVVTCSLDICPYSLSTAKTIDSWHPVPFIFQDSASFLISFHYSTKAEVEISGMRAMILVINLPWCCQREECCFFVFNFYWSIVDLQCCVSFRCTAK